MARPSRRACGQAGNRRGANMSRIGVQDGRVVPVPDGDYDETVAELIKSAYRR